MPDNNLEQSRFGEKIKELRVLFIFILAAAVVSALVMNMVILPISFFALTCTSAYTAAVKYALLGALCVWIIMRVRRTVLRGKESGLGPLEAVSASLMRRIRKTGYFLSILSMTVLLLGAVYFVLSLSNFIIPQLLK